MTEQSPSGHDSACSGPVGLRPLTGRYAGAYVRTFPMRVTLPPATLPVVPSPRAAPRLPGRGATYRANYWAD